MFCVYPCVDIIPYLVCRYTYSMYVCLRLTHISLRHNHSVQSLHHTHKQQTQQATGKQHYLEANPSHGVRQLQTLHVTPPCHLYYTHTHIYAHTRRHTPQSRTALHTFSLFHLSLIPLSLPLSTCHSLSLALCKIALRRAATVLRNSVIYWQFPPQVSGILYLNMSAATLNKTVLSIYISLPQPGPAPHCTRHSIACC